jgi:hypothetical protein
MEEKYRIETTRKENLEVVTEVYKDGKISVTNTEDLHKQYRELIVSHEEIVKKLHGIEKVVTTFNYKS